MVLPWAAAGWAVGLALGPLASLPVLSWWILAAGAAIFGYAFRRRTVYGLLFVCLAVACVGGARAQAALPRPEASSVADFNDLPVLLTVRGVVVEPPVVRGRTLRVRLEVDGVARDERGPWLKISGRVQAETTQVIGVEYGDRLQVRGWLSSPRNDPGFAQADVLARAGVFSVLRAVGVERLATGQGHPVLGFFYRLRQRALAALSAAVPPEEAALLGGVVLGADETMPAHLQQVFSRTGTTHILAVSGFNVALVAGTFGALFGRWLGARRGAVAAGLAIVCYTILVGAEPSAVRASIMAGLAIIARLLGRRGNAMTSLAATGMIMTAWRPSLLADIGFQLSFAATLGLVVFAEPFEHAAMGWFEPAAGREPGRVVGILREVVLLTLAAQLATLPLTAYHFGRLPATALPANFLILPIQPALMILGSLTAVGGMVWPPAGMVLGWVTYPLATYNLRVVEAFAGMPLASLAVGPVSLGGVLAAYVAIFAVAAALRARSQGWKAPISMPAWGGVAAVGLLTSLAWKVVIDSPDARLHATLFSSGDVLVESPTGRFVLLRPATTTVLPAADIGRRLPLMSPSLDWILLPSPDSAQGFLAARPGDRLTPRGILHVGPEPDLSTLEAPGRALRIEAAASGLRLNLGGGSLLEILEASDEGTAVLVSLGRACLLVLLGLPYSALGATAPTGPTAVLADDAHDVDDQIAAWIVGIPGPGVAFPSLSTGPAGWLSLQTDGVHIWAESGD